MPPFDKVIDHRDEDHCDENHRRPIEVVGGHGGDIRPKGPERGERGVEGGDDVDGQTESSQRPTRLGQRLRILQFPHREARDANGVRRHLRGELETEDGVESGAGAEIDERQQDGDAERQDRRVDRDVDLVVHAGDPGTARQSTVTCKGPRLPGAGGREGDVADHEQEDGDDGQDVGAGDGVRHGDLEDVEEWVAGGVVEGVVDGGDGEEQGAEEDEAAAAVDPEGPHHRTGHG